MADTSIDTFFKNRAVTHKAVPIYSAADGGWRWVKWSPSTAAQSRADMNAHRPSEAQLKTGTYRTLPHPTIKKIERKNTNQQTCDKVAAIVRRMNIK